MRPRLLAALLAALLVAGGIAAAIVIVTGGEQERTKPATFWQQAGAFVWHEENVDPAELGRLMRDNHFGWVALRLHDGLQVDTVAAQWIERFRAASGLAVGGWGVQRGSPDAEARLAADLVVREGLAFYIADAEAEYGYTGPDGESPERFARSAIFARRFRSLQPGLPVAVTSYCRADQNDLDWRAWRQAGFAFLPQAYVNNFGDAATPASCLAGAKAFFDPGDVHPVIGTYPVDGRAPAPAEYAALLKDAGTVGFSLYLAEVNMPAASWAAYGRAIEDLGIAAGG